MLYTDNFKFDTLLFSGNKKSSDEHSTRLLYQNFNPEGLLIIGIDYQLKQFVFDNNVSGYCRLYDTSTMQKFVLSTIYLQKMQACLITYDLTNDSLKIVKDLVTQIRQKVQTPIFIVSLNHRAM